MNSRARIEETSARTVIPPLLTATLWVTTGRGEATMQRCQHSCGCEGHAVGRDPDSMQLLCAGCMGRVILGTDCAAARKYFGHVPVRFAERDWPEPEPLRDADRRPLPCAFGEEFLLL